MTQPDLQPPTRHERGPPFPEPAGEEAHLFQRPPTWTRFHRKSMHISSLPSCASIMKALFTHGRIWGPRPCSAPTPVATNDFSEREPLLVGQKRPRRSSSVASMLNISTVGDSMRLRLSCRRRKHFKPALLALLFNSALLHDMLTFNQPRLSSSLITSEASSRQTRLTAKSSTKKKKRK